MRGTRSVSTYTADKFMIPWSTNPGTLAVADDGDFLGIGTQTANGSESILQSPMRACVVTAITARTDSNTTSGAEVTTLTLRNNAASTSIVLTIPVVVEGTFRQTGLAQFNLSDLSSILFNTDSVAGVNRFRGFCIEGEFT